MKKIIFSIFVLAAIIIAFFIFFIYRNIDRNQILYQSLVTNSDVVYKTIDNKNLTLDILMPTKEVYETTPVIFYVHGGSFVEGDKSWLTKDIGEYVTRAILDSGYAIISLNYRLLDEDTHFPENLIDIKDAIRYINSKAEDYEFDTNNFGIYGTNAGAYLALTVAYSPSGLYLGDSQLVSFSAEVKYAIDFYGITKMSDVKDINHMTSQELIDTQNDLDIFYGETFDIYNLTEEDYELIEQYDPLSYISNDTIPTLIIHGTNDALVNINQSDMLETKLNEYNIEYEYYKILSGNNGLTNITEGEINNIQTYVVDFLSAQHINEVD